MHVATLLSLNMFPHPTTFVTLYVTLLLFLLFCKFSNLGCNLNVHTTTCHFLSLVTFNNILGTDNGIIFQSNTIIGHWMSKQVGVNLYSRTPLIRSPLIWFSPAIGMPPLGMDLSNINLYR